MPHTARPDGRLRSVYGGGIPPRLRSGDQSRRGWLGLLRIWLPGVDALLVLLAFPAGVGRPPTQRHACQPGCGASGLARACGSGRAQRN